LGGTTEARELAQELVGRSDLDIEISLAGRTANIVEQRVPIRVGGFGGADGLATYLREKRIDALIDATHPFASVISLNARAAASSVHIPLIALRRPEWTPRTGDRWISVNDWDEAIAQLGTASRRVFLALGRKDAALFACAPQHFYLVRSVDPIDPPLAVPQAVYVLERGPFKAELDRKLLEQHGIEIVVARNSGGAAAYAKIEAARALGVPVLMLRRPSMPDMATVPNVVEAVAWLSHRIPPGKARGV